MTSEHAKFYERNPQKIIKARRVTVVTVRCVSCGHVRGVREGEIPAGDHPMCERCFSPMIPVSATVKS